MNTAVIIVTYNSAATLPACLASVLAARQAGDELIVVDNASRDATPHILTRLAATLPPTDLTLILNTTNRGFAGAVNQGIRASHAPLVALLNPDTIVPPGWLQKLAHHLRRPAVAAVGPVSNFAAGRQSIACHWQGGLPQDLGVQQADERLCRANAGRSESAALLIGFCLLVRRTLLERLGGLDERLFLGNDDLELSWRLRVHGYELRIACDCFVYHEGQHSFRSDPQTETGRLVGQSSDALYAILETCYGAGRVPSPMALWGIDWFAPPSSTGFNPHTRLHQVLTKPKATVLTDKRLPLTSIIILAWNQWDYTCACLEALERHTPEPIEIIVVDNGSQDGTSAFLDARAAADQRYHLIKNSVNRGYAAGCNQGLAAARGEYLVLLNNDVLVTPGWLPALQRCWQSVPRVGIVGPLTNNASGVQGLGPQEYGAAGLDGFAQAWHRRFGGRRIPSRRLVGFCILFHRELYQQIGGLDERFGTGNYEDDDFCLRAAIAGYRNMIAGDVYLHHYGSVTFAGAGLDYRNVLGGNWTLFREKWSAPVSDPQQAALVARCRLREEVEQLLLAEQHETVVQQLHTQGELLRSDNVLAELFAWALWGCGHFEKAGGWSSVALPLSVTAHGMAALQQGRPDEAEALFWQALERDPGFSGSYPFLADLAAARGETEYAAALVLRGAAQNPVFPGYLAAVAKHCGEAHADSLLQILQQDSHLWPESRQVWRLLVTMAARFARHEEAVAAAENYLVRFGVDTAVLEAGLAARRLVGGHCRTAAAGSAISLCMIVKNEEQHLARCLSSCRPVVHDISVLDTGSSDRTPQIAELFGARVRYRAWDGDFSAARNAALEGAQGDWILIMDADERLSLRDHATFTQTVAEHDAACGFSMVSRNYTLKSSLEGFHANDGQYPEDEAGIGWTESRKVRLFPNCPAIRFAGVVHETVDAAVLQAGLPLVQHPVPIQHYGGLDVAREAEKKLFYYDLGKQKLAQHRDLKGLYELAVQAADLEYFNEAEQLWREFLRQAPDQAVAWFNLGYVLLQQGQLAEAGQASQRAMALQPDYQAAVANLAVCQFGLLSFKDAAASLAVLREQFHDNATLQLLDQLLRCLQAESCEGVLCADFRSDGARAFLGRLQKLLEQVGRTGDAAQLRQVAGF